MDSIPPTYIQATNRDHWSVISSFVQSQDLCAAALVSRRWNLIFTPHLWGNPASHFGRENDAVYIALVRFKRTLSWARIWTREHTHTLQLPPAHPELYEGPKAEWLRDIVKRLPRLQSLIVSGLPFFDHESLMNLRSQGPNDLWNPASLRLLEACRCPNATPLGLREALVQFSSLTYLDLSQTLPAKDPRVLNALGHLPKLQVLKLRNIGLRDEDVALISKTIGLSVRSIDVRDNRITDIGVREILQNCFITSNQANEITRRNMVESGSLPRSMQEYFGIEIPEVYKTNFQEQFVYNRLTSGFFRHLGIEDTLGTGVTHLYLSGNLISVNAVADLLRMQRLHVLDVGNISMALQQKSLFKANGNTNTGAECLIPLVEQNSENLTYLRIHHSIVTNSITPETPELIELDAGTGDPPANNEMANSAHELPGDEPSIPIFELEGSPVPPIPAQSLSRSNANTASNGISRPSSSQNSSNSQTLLIPSPIFGHTLDPGSAHATEFIVSPLTPNFPTAFPSLGSSPLATSLSGLSSESATRPSPQSLQVPGPSLEGQQNRERTYSGIMINHENKIKLRKSQPHGLLPSMIPHVTKLVFTDFPSHSYSTTTAQNFISFIAACADEETWSQMQSRFAYEFPPGSQRTASDRHFYARSLFALNRIVLEISRGKPLMNPSSQKASKSSVEDPDCEVFWQAASDDFSFFGSAGEDECGVLKTESTRRVPLEARMGKMLVGEPEEDAENNGSASQLSAEPIDVLSEISKFRQQKRVAYSRAVLRRDPDLHVDGYWSGDISIVR